MAEVIGRGDHYADMNPGDDSGSGSTSRLERDETGIKVTGQNKVAGVLYEIVSLGTELGTVMVPVGPGNALPIKAGDSSSCDAFGRWRVSNPETLFDSKFLTVDKLPLFWDESAAAGTSSSTPTANKPYSDITSTDATADTFVRQTFRRFNYQPGKGQLVLMTGVLKLSGGGTGVQRRIGLFDDDNGAFFEDDTGTVGVTVRTKDSGSAVDATVTQANWNKDTMDGTGDSGNPSGLTADFSKAQVFVVDFQWLSIGRVRFGLEIGGVITYVHEVNQANTSTIPWCANPCLPLRYEMITTSGSGVASMRCICGVVISEGGTNDVGTLRHNSTAGTQIDMDTEDTLYAIKGIRLKSTHLGTTVKIIKIAVTLQSASDDVEWVLVFNPAIAGEETWTGQTNSSVETLTGAAGNTVTGGTHIDSGYVSTGAGQSSSGGNESTTENALIIGSSISGTPQTIVLCARPINGSATDVRIEGGLSWRELS